MNMINTTNAASIASRAMLVSLKISGWTGRKLDRRITNEVNAQHGAGADAGRYNKMLVSKESLEPVHKLAARIHTEFRARTLPWLDGGQRVMAAETFMNHSAWLSKIKREYTAEVEAFLAAYPRHVQEAQGRLNSMFNPDDYPTVDQLRGKFSIEVNVSNVPDANDFRCNVSAEQKRIIEAEIEQTVREATKTAVADVYRRIADVTGRMVERLNAYKPSTEKGKRSEGVFKDSLVTNVQELIEIMPALNITGDPKLAELAFQMEKLTVYDAPELRKNVSARKQVADHAKAIFDQISDFAA